MAGEDDNKTEDPTQHKLNEAINKGDVAKSQEVSAWFVLFASALVIAMLSGSTASSIMGPMRALMEKAGEIRADGAGMTALLRSLLLVFGFAVGLPILFLSIGGLLGSMLQHRLIWSTEGLALKFSRLSPGTNASRIFGKEAWVSFGKGLVKLTLVGAVLIKVMWPEKDMMDAMMRMDIALILPLAKDLLMKVFITVLAIMFVVAAMDYIYQYRTWYARQRMSHQEMKEEFKQQDGNPEVKGKIRQLRRERARKRMMSNVPQATVVITNPTHYAVALRYEDGMRAPICIAKGMDNIALKIREVAGEHNIPVMENPPLARTLHATVEIDREIPEEHYKAVAEVISFVLRLRGKLRR
jgi:flagellar biosynthetic protein FlhB